MSIEAYTATACISTVSACMKCYSDMGSQSRQNSTLAN